MFKDDEMKWQNIVAVIAVVGLLLVALNLSRDKQKTEKTITVSGTYETDVSPDQAEIFLSVVTQSAKSEEAQKENKAVSNAVIAALKDLGIPDADIETVSYHLQKKTQWDYDKRKEIDLGYEQQHTLKVTTQKLGDVGEIVDLAVNNGVNNVQSVQFVLSDDEQSKLRTQLLKKAAVNAQGKAEALADALDRSLGKPITVSENSYFGGPVFAREFAMKADAAAAEPLNIQPESVHIQATVNVVYGLK